MSWLPPVEGVGSLDPLTARLAHLPQLPEAFDNLMRAAMSAVDPVALEVCRLRMADLLSVSSELAWRSPMAVEHGLDEDKIVAIAQYATDGRFTPYERAVIAFTEQFLMDVSGTQDAQVELLIRYVGHEGFYLLVWAIFLTEARLRLIMLWGLGDEDRPVPAAPASVAAAPSVASPAAEPPRGPVGPRGRGRLPMPDAIIDANGYADHGSLYGDRIRAARQRWENVLPISTQSTGRIDPVTLEYVRMKNAQHQDCLACKSTIYRSAYDAGLDHATASEQVGDFRRASLPARQHLALEYAESYLLDASSPAQPIASALIDELGPAGLVELAMSLVYFSANKVTIAIGASTYVNVPADGPIIL